VTLVASEVSPGGHGGSRPTIVITLRASDQAVNGTAGSSWTHGTVGPRHGRSDTQHRGLGGEYLVRSIVDGFIVGAASSQQVDAALPFNLDAVGRGHR
jgi:hypothetical protein